jgi:hypothetical protein
MSSSVPGRSLPFQFLRFGGLLAVAAVTITGCRGCVRENVVWEHTFNKSEARRAYRMPPPPVAPEFELPPPPPAGKTGPRSGWAVPNVEPLGSMNARQNF